MSNAKIKKWMQCFDCKHSGYYETDGMVCPMCKMHYMDGLVGLMRVADPPFCLPAEIPCEDVKLAEKIKAHDQQRQGERIMCGADWIEVNQQRAEIRWTGSASRKLSKKDLARLASDILAIEAGEMPRWFDEYNEEIHGTVSEEEEPPYFIRKPKS